MEGLDGGFERDAQETRGLWIEPLPVQIMSEWHQKFGPWKWGGHPCGLAAKFAVPKVTAVCLVSDVIVRILGQAMRFLREAQPRSAQSADRPTSIASRPRFSPAVKSSAAGETIAISIVGWRWLQLNWR
jgi:hypothetical protein